MVGRGESKRRGWTVGGKGQRGGWRTRGEQELDNSHDIRISMHIHTYIHTHIL